MSQFNRNKLQIVQNKTVRTIFAYDYRQMNLSTSDIRSKYKLLDIEQLLQFSCATLMYKIDNKLIKTNHRIMRNNDHGYMTRIRNHPRLNHYRTEMGRLNVFRVSTIVYNNLNNDLKTESSLHKFKKSLKNLLLNSRFSTF